MAKNVPLSDTLIDGLLQREGGYVDHVADRGGATRWGITEAVARAHGWTGSMRDLPRSEAVRITRKTYWDGPRLGEVAARSTAIAAEMLDTGYNMGPVVAVTFLQRALNVLNRGGRDYPEVARDGEIGPRTLAALDGFLRARGKAGEAVLIKALDTLQGARYIDLAERRPANEAFLYGWLANRLGPIA